MVEGKIFGGKSETFQEQSVTLRNRRENNYGLAAN